MDVLEKITKLGEKHWVFIHEGQRIGHAKFLEKEDRVLLTDLYVLKKHRRKGFGREIINYILKRTGKAVHVIPSSGAYGFYIKLGFKNDRGVFVKHPQEV